MQAWHIVLLKSAGMLLVMMVGWLAGRSGPLGPAVTQGLGRLVVDCTFPALVFSQMLRTVTPAVVRSAFWIPLSAPPAISVAALVALALARAAGARDQRRTFVFLGALSNWIFLPLVIAEALYGAAGVRFVLLYNVGAQLTLWTLGVGILRGGGWTREQLRGLLLNPGLLATVAGILAALGRPAMVAGAGSGAAALRTVGQPLLMAVDLFGGLTVPLALLVTGAQLAAVPARAEASLRPVVGLVLVRLVVAPVVTMLLLRVGLMVTGARLPEAELVTFIVIVAMPVAVSTSAFIERYGGDRRLAALGIFWTTLLGLLTVPALVRLVQSGGW